MTGNPFFAGQSQKKRLAFSTYVPTAAHQTNLRGLTKSCDIPKDRPSPLRIIKRNERTQSLDILRECRPKDVTSIDRRPAPANDYHEALLSVTERRSRVNVTPSPIAPSLPTCRGRRTTPIHDEFTRSIRNSAPMELPGSVRSVSDESKSSVNTSVWNSFQAADENTRLSSFGSGGQNEAPCANGRTGFRQPSNDTASLQSVLPHVLSPHIMITTDTSGYYDGRRCIWAGIEISGKLSHTYSAETVVGTLAQKANNKESIIDHQLGKIMSINSIPCNSILTA